MLGVFNKTQRQLEQEREQRRSEQFSALPAAIQQWLEELERDGRRQVMAIRKESAARLKPVMAEAAKLQAQIDTLAGELSTAQSWLANIPEGADSSQAVERFTVAQLWPGRIDELRSRLGELSSQQAAIERDKNKALDKVRNDTRLVILDTARRLEPFEPSILD